MTMLGSISDACLPNYERLLADLVAIPSVSSSAPGWDQSNLGVVNVLQDWFAKLGFNAEVMDVPGQPGKANLIATCGAGNQGLVLSGHTDTVPFDASKWQSDPFKLTTVNDRMFGLGTCDMKGFFPIIVEALRNLRGARLKQPLIVLATADEESSMSGARALADAGALRGRAALIGEPTSLKPVRMHKGILMESLQISGKSGHSSNPALGNSALEAMHEAVGELLRFRERMQEKYSDPAFEVGVPTLNLGRMQGGDSANRICGHCELSFDLRLLPGMNTIGLREELSHIVKSIADRRRVDIQLQSLIEEVEPFATKADSALVKLCEELSGTQAQAVAFATEAPFLSKMGFETIVMGAGSIDQAHQPDEFMVVDQVKVMAKHLEALIRYYCL